MQKRSLRFVSNAIAAGLIALATGAYAQTAGSNIQTNTGRITSGIQIQNIVVENGADLVSTAVGNLLVATSTPAVTFNSQNNGGEINASVSIMGPSTRFGSLDITATALGNGLTQTFSNNTAAVLSNNTQSNIGNVGASITWNEDPTGSAKLNASALGNMISVGVR